MDIMNFTLDRVLSFSKKKRVTHVLSIHPGVLLGLRSVVAKRNQLHRNSRAVVAFDVRATTAFRGREK